LADPRHGVKVCAALAPALADDEEATEILIQAAAHPRALDHGFSDQFVPPPSGLMMPAHLEVWPHQFLIRTVCERVADFERLLTGAIAAVDLRGPYRPVPEFGPYLRRAFPPGGDVTAHQRAFARAIARREELWDGTYHDVAEMFAAAGLPADRGWWHDLAHPPVPHDDDGVTVIAAEPRLAVRQRPEMYLGAPRTDPSVPTRLVEMLGRDGASVKGHLPKRVTVTIEGAAELADLDRVATSLALSDPRYYALSVAAAISLWVDIRLWNDGTTHRRAYIDGVPTGEWTTTAEDQAAGFRIVFDLDGEWLPAASGF
jgi:hypothetical protein